MLPDERRRTPRGNNGTHWLTGDHSVPLIDGGSIDFHVTHCLIVAKNCLGGARSRYQADLTNSRIVNETGALSLIGAAAGMAEMIQQHGDCT